MLYALAAAAAGLKLPAMAPHMACVCNKQQRRQRRQQLAKFLGNPRGCCCCFLRTCKNSGFNLLSTCFFLSRSFSFFPPVCVCLGVCECVLCSLNDMAHAHDPSGGVCTAGVGFLWAASGWVRSNVRRAGGSERGRWRKKGKVGRGRRDGAKAGRKLELVYSGVDITAATRVFYVHLST